MFLSFLRLHHVTLFGPYLQLESIRIKHVKPSTRRTLRTPNARLHQLEWPGGFRSSQSWSDTLNSNHCLPTKFLNTAFRKLLRKYFNILFNHRWLYWIPNRIEYNKITIPVMFWWIFYHGINPNFPSSPCGSAPWKTHWQPSSRRDRALFMFSWMYKCGTMNPPFFLCTLNAYCVQVLDLQIFVTWKNMQCQLGQTHISVMLCLLNISMNFNSAST